jgi:hypothetical protein
VDDHEWDDIVEYHQKVFLPQWKELEPNLHAWMQDGTEEEVSRQLQQFVVWFHHKSTFYANDCQKKHWVHKSEKVALHAKGKGAFLMVANCISADYRWLWSPDGKKSAYIIFKARKTWDGYFTNTKIILRLELIIDIIQKHYPNNHHIFVYDNVITHMKWPATAPTATKMTKNPSTKFGAGVTMTIENKIQYGTNGKPQKHIIQMGPGILSNGQPHYFYDVLSTTVLRTFKEMTKLLQECGLTEEVKLNGSCKKFKCSTGAMCCCQKCVLYNHPDFHCELNFIEHCWGHAKQVNH